MKDRVEFKAYGMRGELLSHTWAVRNTIAEKAEREMYQSLLEKGHYGHVEVIESVMRPTGFIQRKK